MTNVFVVSDLVYDMYRIYFEMEPSPYVPWRISYYLTFIHLTCGYFIHSILISLLQAKPGKRPYFGASFVSVAI